MDRPYVVTHMLCSIDGKVTGSFLSLDCVKESTEVYYEINRNYKADAFACGRITMEESFTGGYNVDLSNYEDKKIERVDYVVESDTDYYAVAFDRHGKLGWVDSKIYDEDPGYNEAHIIEVLCEEVEDSYLAYLQDINVSYIFAGKEEVDIKIALSKLKDLFKIKTLMLEGGSILNNAFAKADVIDELSIVYTSVCANKNDKPLFYEGDLQKYKIREVKTYNEHSVWVNYLKEV